MGLKAQVPAFRQAGQGEMKRSRQEYLGVKEKPGPDGRHRSGIFPGALVKIEQKKDQGSGRLTEGRVREILTSSAFHPHGIKVRLDDGSVGRVQEINKERSSS